MRKPTAIALEAVALVAALFVGVVSSSAVTSHSATTSPVSNHDVGLFEDLQYLTGPELDTRLDEYKALGVQWARFQLIWANVQRAGPTSFDWGPYDELIPKLLQRGIHPLGVIDTTPPWAARFGGCGEDTCGPADASQYAAFAQSAATRSEGKVGA